MARRAEWKPVRPRPETPNERWRRRREEVGFAVRRRLVPLIILSPSAALLGFGLSMGWVTGFVVALTAVITGTFFALRLPYFDKQSLSGLADLLPLPLPEGTFPVSVSLRRRGVPTGKDEGIAAFADGWLVVEGRRTSFSFRAGDARSENQSSGLRSRFPDGQELVLWPLSVRDLPPDAGAFYHAIRRWLREDLKPEGEPILPPLGKRWL